MNENYKKILNSLKERPPRKINDHIVLIDGMNTFIRSFAIIKALNPDGHHIGGMVGFLRSLGYLNRILDPTRIVCIFDSKGSSTNRKNINPNYKAQRVGRITHWEMFDNKVEEESSITSQLERLFDYLECLPVKTVMLEKLEADDIIAYISKKYSESGSKVTIVSSDKDFFQLVDKNIEIYSPVRRKFFTRDNIEEQTKVIPENYNIVKALTGDASDNLTGIKGLGIKTILKEIPEIKSDTNFTLEKVYSICEERLDSKLIFSKIIDSWDKVETNFKLMDLHLTSLDEKEKNFIDNLMKEEIPSLQKAAFLLMLELDKIDGIVKNTEAWLDSFKLLKGYK